MDSTQILVILLVAIVAIVAIALLWPREQPQAPLELNSHPSRIVTLKPIIKPGDYLTTHRYLTGKETSSKQDSILPPGTYLICTIEYCYQSPEKPQEVRRLIVTGQDNKRYSVEPSPDFEIRPTYPPPRPRLQQSASK